MVLVLVCAISLSACSFLGVRGAKEAGSSGSVGKAGGVVTSRSGDVEVRVPSGAVGSTTSVAINEHADEPQSVPADLTRSTAVAVGDAVLISPQNALPGARVAMRLNADELPSAQGRRATTVNAFIAVFNESLKAWVPLVTKYEVNSHRLVAVAPHFSLFRKFVVDPAKKFWSATKTVVNLVTEGIIATFGAPRQKQADCPHATAEWTVDSRDDAFSGCVEPASGDAALRLQNGLLFGYTARAPIRLDLSPNEYDDDLSSFASTFMRGLTKATGALAVPPKGRAQVLFSSADVPAGRHLSIDLQPDGLGLAIDTILTLLNWIPESREVQATIVETSVRRELLAGAAPGMGFVSYLEHVSQTVRHASVDKPQNIVFLSMVTDAVTCLLSQPKGGFEIHSDGTVVTDSDISVGEVVETAKACLNTALALAGASLKKAGKEGFSDVVALLGAIPDTARILVALAQAGGQSFKHWGARTSLTLTHERIPPTSPGGGGTPPTTSPPTPDQPAPDGSTAPRSLTCESSPRAIAVRWLDPLLYSGVKVTGYRVSQTGSGFTDEVAANTVVVSYSDLESGKKYTVTVTTLLNKGKGATASITCKAG
jgi:hypothetical protein